MLFLAAFLSTYILFTVYLLANAPETSSSDLAVTQIAGKELWTQKKCVDCHTLTDKAEGKLTPVPNKGTDEWFQEHIEKESPVVLREATSKRKKRRVLKAEIAALDAYLYQSDAETKKRIDSMSEAVYEGAYLVYQNNCINCHTIAGIGKESGPDLTYVADKRTDKNWLLENLRDPKQFSPETTMPGFDQLPAEKLNKIVAYLLTLKK
jgi:mono/diheme cytochrome c family protein